MTEPYASTEAEGRQDGEERIFAFPHKAIAIAEAEANHRIANNLSMVAAYLRLQAGDVADRELPMSPIAVKSILREAASRVESVGKIHRHLAHSERRKSVNLSGYLEELIRELAATMAYNGVVTFAGEDAACFVLQDRVVPLALCVLEAVTNAIKYAHPAGVAGRIAVDCAVDEDGAIEITVEDDGVGLPDGFDPDTGGGLGLRVMRSLAGQLGGSVAFASDGLGLTVRITAP